MVQNFEFISSFYDLLEKSENEALFPQALFIGGDTSFLFPLP